MGSLTIRGWLATRRDWNGIHIQTRDVVQKIDGHTTKTHRPNIATIIRRAASLTRTFTSIFEVILYIIEGKMCATKFGDGAAKKFLENEAGDFHLHIKPGVPHEVFNMSDEPNRSSPSVARSYPLRSVDKYYSLRSETARPPDREGA